MEQSNEEFNDDVVVFETVPVTSEDIANMLRRAADKIANKQFYDLALLGTHHNADGTKLNGGEVLVRGFNDIRTFCEYGGYDPAEDKLSGNQPDGSFIMPTYGQSNESK